MPNLIKMIRGELLADVHPNEVENFRRGGYVLVDDQVGSTDDPDTRLASILNDRALPKLAEMGIETYDAFIAAALQAKEDGELAAFAKSVPYLRLTKLEEILANAE